MNKSIRKPFTVAFVPAKGESIRIPAKNKRIFAGTELYVHKINQLLKCKEIDEVWLDTEDQEMIEQVSDFPIKVLKRHQNLSTNSTDGHKLFDNEVQAVASYADIVVQCLCTAPFLDDSTIDRALTDFKKAKNLSMLAINKVKQYVWQDGAPVYGYNTIPNSSEVQDTILESMSLYAIKRQLFSKGRRFHKDPMFVETNAIQNLDINRPEDLVLAENIYTGNRAKERNYFRLVKNNLNSSILSDVTKDLGLKCMLPPNIKLQTNGSILGRAKTLKLRSLTSEEQTDGNSWQGIYGALNTYKYVVDGDILVIDNPTGLAYFGDLNCALAVRSGAVGAVVNGLTRDTASVATLDFPVYSTGVWANDIKYEGTVENFNRTLDFDSVRVKNGDIIFADYQGVLSIPDENWDSVRERALEVASNENKIRSSILGGTGVSEIIDKYGTF